MLFQSLSGYFPQKQLHQKQYWKSWVFGLIFSVTHRELSQIKLKDLHRTHLKSFAKWIILRTWQLKPIKIGVPRGNGHVGRVNRTVLSILSKLSADNPFQCFKYVGDVQLAINSNYQSSIKKSHFKIIFVVNMKNNSNPEIKHFGDEAIIEEFNAERDEIVMRWCCMCLDHIYQHWWGFRSVVLTGLLVPYSYEVGT